MNLLCFAHQGECVMFLRHLALRPLSLSFAKAWQGDGIYVLLTGEGIEQAGYTLAAFCARYEQDISAIVNLGIAGGLDAQLTRDKVYRVRTIYGAKHATYDARSSASSLPECEERASKRALQKAAVPLTPECKERASKRALQKAALLSSSAPVEHHSYTCHDQSATYDCISARERVLDAKTGTALANFAALVDRELWGLASVATQFKFPLLAAKLVSEVIFDTEICQRARAKRTAYSAALYEFWHENFANVSPPTHADPMAECIAALRTQGFYFTKALQDKVVTLLTRLALKHSWPAGEILAQITEQIEIAKILPTTPQPKQRTKLLLHALQELHDPFRTRFNQHLATVTAPLRKVAKVSHHEDFANDDLIISSTIKNNNDLTALQQALASFDYQRYRNLLNGLAADT